MLVQHPACASHNLFLDGWLSPQFVPDFQALSLCPRKDAAPHLRRVSLATGPALARTKWRTGYVPRCCINADPAIIRCTWLLLLQTNDPFAQLETHDWPERTTNTEFATNNDWHLHACTHTCAHVTHEWHRLYLLSTLYITVCDNVDCMDTVITFYSRQEIYYSH